MSVQVQHGEQDVERLVGAGREAAEGAGEVPARGPPAMLVEAIGGDRGLEELDDVVDVRALPEQRQRVGVPLLGDGVRAAPVVKVGELVERPGIAPEEELASLVKRGVRGAHDPAAPRPARGSRAWRRAGGGGSLSSSSRTSARACPSAWASPRSTARRISPQMIGCHQGGQRLGARAPCAARAAWRRARSARRCPPSLDGYARAVSAPRARARPRCSPGPGGRAPRDRFPPPAARARARAGSSRRWPARPGWGSPPRRS